MSRPVDGSRARAIEGALAVATVDAAGGWIELEQNLNLDEATGGWVLGRYDLTSSAGWIEAQDATRQRILEAALQFLKYMPAKYPNAALHDGTSSSGYRAAVLLLETAAAEMDQLTDNDWRYWLPAFAQSAVNTAHPELLRRFTAIAYQRHQAATLDVLRTSLLDHAAESRIHTLLDSFNPIWDAPIAEVVAEAGNDASVSVASQGQILASLLRHGDPRGAELAARLRSEGAASEREIVAGRHVLLFGDATTIGDWVEAFRTEQDLARAVLQATASLDDRLVFPSTRLPNSLVKDLYLLASDLFPPDGDPELLAGTPVSDDPRIKVGWLRDRLLGQLVRQGTWDSVGTIEEIISLRPNLALPQELHQEAIEAALRKTWTPISPIQSVLTFVHDSQHHIVRNADQLLDHVLESLSRLQAELVEGNAAVDLWSEWGNPIRYRPKRELSFSDYVKRFLDRDLERYLIAANREVENIRGNETDILVQCMVPGAIGEAPQRFAVVIEAKGSWNDGLLTAMETQLADRYLHEHDANRGIYLVGWYNCEAWDPDDSAKAESRKYNLSDLKETLANQAQALTDEKRRIKAVVLNAALRNNSKNGK